MSAFGVGVHFDDKDRFKEQSKAIERHISRFSTSYGRLITRLKTIDKWLKFHEYEIAAMAARYDNRMEQNIV